MESKPLLAIRCITYNHEPYIRQCLEGFVMQKTNFPFIAIVHDDASTDSTAKIIREYAEKYPDIIRPIYETENQYSKHDGSLARIMNEAVPKDVKYIAMCEGDDYWIDPNKLQMQVDFLENNLEYGMCYTRTKLYDQCKGKVIGKFGLSYTDFNRILYKGNPIPILTVVLRNDLFEHYYQEIQPNNKNWKMGDYPLWLWFAKNSKIKFYKKITSVYRILNESASHSYDINRQVAFGESSWNIKKYFIDKYKMPTIPLFDEHRIKAQFYNENNDRQKAYDEFKQTKRNGLNDSIRLLVYSNSVLYVLYKCYVFLKKNI